MGTKAARLVISGEDRFSPEIAKIENRIERLSRTAHKVSAEGLGAKNMERLGTYVASQAGLGAESMRRLALSAAQVSANLYKAQAGASALGGALRHLDRLGGALDRIGRRTGSFVRDTASRAIGTAAGIGIARGVDELGRLATGGIAAAADYQTARARARSSGLSEAELVEVERRAGPLARDNPNISRQEILVDYIDARLGTDDPLGLLETKVKTRAAFKAAGLDTSGLGYLDKALGIYGITDPEEQRRFYESQVRVAQQGGTAYRPENVFLAAQYSKGSAGGYSERFRNNFMGMLALDESGNTLGNALNQLVKSAVYTPTAESLGEALRLGLVNKNQLIFSKKGNIKGLKTGERIAGAELLQSDPDLWVENFLKPIHKKKGIVSESDIKESLYNLAGAATADDKILDFYFNAEQYRKQEKLLPRTAGFAAVGGQLEANDPALALDVAKVQTFNKAVESLAPVVSSFSQMAKAYAALPGAPSPFANHYSFDPTMNPDPVSRGNNEKISRYLDYLFSRAPAPAQKQAGSAAGSPVSPVVQQLGPQAVEVSGRVTGETVVEGHFAPLEVRVSLDAASVTRLVEATVAKKVAPLQGMLGGGSTGRSSPDALPTGSVGAPGL